MRTGTVRAAAGTLGVSHSTVARRIDTMERKLAGRLFDRLPTGYVVTAAGEDMLKVAELVENEMDGLERRILGHDRKLAGRVRVTMVDGLATGLLMPHLADFTRKYPDIELEVETTMRRSIWTIEGRISRCDLPATRLNIWSGAAS